MPHDHPGTAIDALDPGSRLELPPLRPGRSRCSTGIDRPRRNRSPPRSYRKRAGIFSTCSTGSTGRGWLR